MPYDAPPDLASLTLPEIADLVAQRKLPPVREWSPQSSSDSLMQITADGRWFHDGGEIKRLAMIRAFSSLLRREQDGRYWLVTPHEKQSIEVEDVPFIAVEMTSEGTGEDRRLAFRLNSDDLTIAGPENVIEMRGDGENTRPYLHIRDGLWAKIARPVFYELAELAIAESPETPALWSNGARFEFGASE